MNTKLPTRAALNQSIDETLASLYWADAHRALAANPPADMGSMLSANGRHFRPRTADEFRAELFGLKYDPVALQSQLEELLRQKQAREFTEEINARGNTVYRFFRQGAERYHWDFGPCREKYGWKQYDTSQDAPYFGVWVHLGRRLTLTYAEGDVTLVKCPTVETLRAELKDMERCYGPAPASFYACSELSVHSGAIVPAGDVTAFHRPRPSI